LPPGCDQNHLCAGEAFINGLAPELPYARPGIALYTAVTPYGEKTPATADAMSVRTRLVSVKRLPAGSTISYGCIRALERDSVVGVALVGYDEGVPRASSDQGVALVRGRRVPQLGTVCMGMIMLDLTDLPDVRVDDEVVLIGKQGQQTITCEEFARRAGTITDEVICRFGLRR
ncbi:MAG: hypothetical protein IJJ33_14870, partial [Victivallales bacterium]|nr:hypothetical protein [Victivallales bacterium]